MSRYPEADEHGYGAPYQQQQHPQPEAYASPYQPPPQLDVHGTPYPPPHPDIHGTPYGVPQGSFSPPPPPPPGAGYNPAPLPSPYHPPTSPFHPPTSPYPSSGSSTLVPSFPPGSHYAPTATPNPFDSYQNLHPDDPFKTAYEQPFPLHTGVVVERHNTPLNPIYNQVPRPVSTPMYENEELEPHGNVDENDIPLLQRDGPSSFPGGFMPGGMPDDAETNNIHYGRIPQRVPRRYKTIKRVELFHGNFVVDCTVPKKLLEMSAMKNEREFTHMRYSGVTCDPNDFKEERYSLRQILYDPPRKTELFIVMTMYNEDEELFCRTMHGVMKNVAHLITRTRSKTWGTDGWKKVVVCIVSDGRMKINARTLSVIAAMGIYQEGIGKNIINGKDVTAHIYEYTTQVSVTPSLKIEGAERGVCPVQVIFCLKEKNQKKINSHRWFFNAFGPVLNPNVCVLLDVGTMPGPTSIYHLWKSFDINSNVGGACGEIVAMKGKYMQNLLNPLVAAQNFEYKMSNILDKPLESIFGYISVLPGAFSAYRYHALQNDSTGNGPLQKYFLGEKMHGAGADIFTANMYLAEDRILCWELVSKRGGSWILHYVKSAYAITDVPDQVPELISQRRRWLNGSFFAAIHSIAKFGYIYRSAHSPIRKFWIHVEMLYQVFNLIFSWFALGNYYIAFKILANAMEDPEFHFNGIHIANVILEYFYVGLLVLCFLLALGNRPQGSKWGYTTAIIGFAVITCYMTFSAFFLAFKGVENIEKSEGPLDVDDIFKNAIFRNIVISILATIGLYLISSLLFFEPWHMITSFLQYTLMAPSYINVLNVYAFANVHDVSWGTKGDNKPATDLGVVATGKNKNEVEAVVPTDQTDIDAAYEDAIHVLGSKPPKAEQKVDVKTAEEDYYRTFRTNVLLAWTLSNGLLVAAVIAGTGDAASKQAKNTVNGYLAFVLFSVAGLAAFRFLGATAYMVVRLFAGE